MYKRQWLGNLYNKIYFGDLISRYNIRNTVALKVLIRTIYLHEKYGEDLYYYNDNVEVDFCLFEQGMAFQVSYSLQDSTTCERETKALIAYAKRNDCSQLYIITMDEEEEIHQDGFTIHVMPIWKVLLRGI